MDFNAITKFYSDKYPNIFAEVERTRLLSTDKGMTWDKTCYFSFESVLATIIYRYIDTKSNIHDLTKNWNIGGKYHSKKGELGLTHDALCVYNLLAWRFGGKHIVDFDELIEKQIIECGISGDIPMNVLRKLPFMGVYVKTKSHKTFDGFLVSSSNGTEKHNSHEFHIVISTLYEGEMISAPIDLSKVGTIDEIADSDVSSLFKNKEDINGFTKQTFVDFFRSMWGCALPLILYLCASNAEITSKTAAAPTIPTLPRNKRAIAPHQPTEWLCGERIGAAIRASAQREANDPTGTGASKRPHIRRAHWHTYRVGVGKANTILKWIHPLAINADDGSDMPVTTRKV